MNQILYIVVIQAIPFAGTLIRKCSALRKLFLEAFTQSFRKQTMTILYLLHTWVRKQFNGILD